MELVRILSCVASTRFVTTEYEGFMPRNPAEEEDDERWCIWQFITSAS